MLHSKGNIIIYLREWGVATRRSYCAVSSVIHFLRCLNIHQSHLLLAHRAHKHHCASLVVTFALRLSVFLLRILSLFITYYLCVTDKGCCLFSSVRQLQINDLIHINEYLTWIHYISNFKRRWLVHLIESDKEISKFSLFNCY
jgi:hypothetical protein